MATHNSDCEFNITRNKTEIAINQIQFLPLQIYSLGSDSQSVQRAAS